MNLTVFTQSDVLISAPPIDSLIETPKVVFPEDINNELFSVIEDENGGKESLLTLPTLEQNVKKMCSDSRFFLCYKSERC